MSTTTASKTKSSTPRSRAHAAVTKAKKAYKEGKPGASARLDKAIKAYAAASCKIKAVKGTKRKQVVASIAKPVKRKATAMRTTKRK
jgi:hypothetical protein